MGLPPATDQPVDSPQASHHAQMTRVVGIGAVLGLVATIAGLVVITSNVSADMRGIAVVATVVPLLIYVVWWYAFSGARTAPGTHAVETQPISDRDAHFDRIFDTTSQAVRNEDFHSTIGHQPADATIAQSLRSSISVPTDPHLPSVDDLRPRRTS